MNKKGFTLIELLAVIIILGILMIIAIPSVTKYISDSRKNSYIDTAKEIISGARNMVNDGKLEMFDTGTTYYIDAACIKTENGEAKSPYGEFTKAYVVVNYDGKGYEYYWTSVDDAGQGIKKITRFDKLDSDLIESDLKISDIPDSLGIDGRSKYMIIDKQQTNCKKGVASTVTDTVSGETGTNPIVYPVGKNKSTVEPGEKVTIGTEEFYVVSNDGNDLVLLARYNLKVGAIYNSDGTKVRDYTSADSGYGLQSSESRGSLTGSSTYNGVIAFSQSNYWNGKVGTVYEGSYCSHTSVPNCAYVYDSNSNLYQYVEAYKTYLIKQGLPSTIKARVMSSEEFQSFYYTDQTAWKETTYWLGSVSSSGVWFVRSFGAVGSNGYNTTSYYVGIRPVIVI